jgi:hypothetical protein
MARADEIGKQMEFTSAKVKELRLIVDSRPDKKASAEEDLEIKNWVQRRSQLANQKMEIENRLNNTRDAQ